MLLVFRAVHALLAVLFAGAAVMLIFIATRKAWSAFAVDSETAIAQSIIEAMGLLAAAVVALQIAETITEEEVIRAADISAPTRVRRFLSRFFVVIVVSLAMGYPPSVLQCVFIAGGTALVTVVWTTLGDFLHAFQRFRAFAVTNLAAGLVLTLASVLAAGFGLGPVGIAAAYATGPVITAAIMEAALRRAGYRSRLTWNPARFKALFNASKALAGQQFITSMQGRLASILLPKLVGISICILASSDLNLIDTRKKISSRNVTSIIGVMSPTFSSAGLYLPMVPRTRSGES